MLLKQLSVAFKNERTPTHCRLPPLWVDLRISLDPQTKKRNRHHKHEVLAVSGHFIATSKRPHRLTLQQDQVAVPVLHLTMYHQVPRPAHHD